MTNIIGIYSSKPGFGKTEIAHYLREEYGFETVRFADPIKHVVRILLYRLGYDHHTVPEMTDGLRKQDPIPSLGGVTPRYMMQTLGTDWGRNMIDSDIWVNATIQSVMEEVEDGNSVVVDDLRFPNEYRALHRMGATFVRVIRFFDGNEEPHSSEGNLDQFHFRYVICNDGTLGDLRDAVDVVLKGINHE